MISITAKHSDLEGWMVQKPECDINTEWQINLPNCLSEHSVTLGLNLHPCAPWNWRKGEVVFRKSVCTVGYSQFTSPLLSEALARLQLLQWSLPPCISSTLMMGTVDLATSRHSLVMNSWFEITYCLNVSVLISLLPIGTTAPRRAETIAYTF